jgi:probable FeS assembly SUF system protein SufT
MTVSNKRILRRECSAVMVPSGDGLLLPAGTPVTITHRLGGSFTVVGEQGMFRIKGKDADALDEPIPVETLEAQTPTQTGVAPEEAALWERLRSVYDPEIPVNIVDLGLVYSLQIVELEDKQYGVLMFMTLTAPGCGMGPSIAADAKERLLSVPGVAEATVEMVWDPPWSQEMISEEGKMQLGLI